MATSKGDRDFLLEQLSGLPVSTKSMMGEYLLYYEDKLIGGLYDGRFLVKKTETNKHFGLSEEIPYPNAKPMYMVDTEDRENLCSIVKATYSGINNNERR